MKELTQKNIKILFSNLCCSKCKNDFTQESISIKNIEGDILICNLTCEKCGKDFGDTVLNFNQKSDKHNPLNIIDGPAPITTDDVIKAHRFIKKMK